MGQAMNDYHTLTPEELWEKYQESLKKNAQ